jgi:AraC family transcriptional regulator of adaptative response / DNA-3-methyladenine glycosylase II
MLDAEACERARLSRDARFDGRFFVGVVTTGIYCRPVCPVQPPKAANVRFYGSASAAARDGLRPCLRCRPEAAPGSPAWSGTPATVLRALRLIDDGALDRAGAGELAQRLGIDARHLRRLFEHHVGASPLQVASTRRLHRAKRLIDTTDLPLAAVAQAAGFGSTRRFNDALLGAYGRSPRELRRRRGRTGSGPVPPHGVLHLRLGYRPPYDAAALLGFLESRAIPGVEAIDRARGLYRRAFRLPVGEHACGRSAARPARPTDAGVVHVETGGAGHLAAKVCHPDARVLLEVSGRLRRLFDLDADPLSFRGRLRCAGPLARRLEALPGIRVPGSWDGFELAVRAVLGQQVTVRGATTLAGRLVEALGEPLPDHLRDASLARTFPSPAAVAGFDLRSIGLPARRAAALRALAAAVAAGELDLDATADADTTRARLTAIRGIGPWTAEYIAMRALRDPDAFPCGDLGLRKAVSPGAPVTSRELQAMAETWRPWRAYAAMLLWQEGAARQPGGRDAQVVP